MYRYKLFLVIVAVIYSTNSIHNGYEVPSEKKYMVYFLQGIDSTFSYYEYWTCGGCIVHPWYVLTAAACVYNLQYLYVIAGTDRFVPLDDAPYDQCIVNTKRRIIRHCAPKDYEIGNYTVDGKWFVQDIILGKVDRPYGNVNDDEFLSFGCPYKPSIIEINYDVDFLQPYLDVIALGWGHTAGFRMEKDYTNWNARTLRYVPGSLLHRSSCKKLLPSKNFTAYHEQFSICFKNKGNVDDQGKFKDFYINSTEEYEDYGGEEGAICQNDHGGPLIAWKGGKEVVIGVASYFLVDKNMTCRGPSVFTSTACVNKFLYCKLAVDGARRTKICKNAGDFTEETDIRWTNINTTITEVPRS